MANGRKVTWMACECHDAAKSRLHRNVLATALGNKLTRITWTSWPQRRNYETRTETEAVVRALSDV